MQAGPSTGAPPALPDAGRSESAIDAAAATKKQLRGSSLLLVGRVLSAGLNLVTQVLIIRELTKTDYGAFAYALAIAAFAQPVVTLGLSRSASRFLSIYEERRDYERLFGTIVMGASIIGSLGLAVVLLVYGLQGWLAGSVVSNREAVALLLILIVTAPVDALDDLIESMFAVFARARSIFFRKHVLAPGLRLAVVLLLILTDRGVRFLAAGYVVAGAIGVLFYGVFLVRVLRQKGLLRHFSLSRLRPPVREVLGFSLVLLAGELVWLVVSTASTVVLDLFRGPEAVANYRAVLTPARMNYRLVTSAFTLLYTPLAARLFTRQATDDLQDLYWRTAAWIAVLSFPVFSITFAMAEPVTVGLFGDRYRDSAAALAWLSLGHYLNAAIGYNALTLQVFGSLRYVLTVNVATAFASVALSLALVPVHGATGAAVATCLALVLQNVLNQLGLPRRTGIRLFDRRYARVYVIVAAASLGLLALGAVLSPSLVVAVALAAAVSLAVVLATRRDIAVADTFPELARLPLAARLLGAPRKGS